MKKKVLTAILPVFVAMAMTACGGNADTEEVGETKAITENTEADAQAEADTGTIAADEEAGAAGEKTPEAGEAFDEIEIGADGSVNGQDFPVIGSYVSEQDKSADYGVNSISCYDLDEFLDENGEVPEEWTGYDSKESNEYSGRWAYPEITPCRFFDDLTLISRTDCSSEYQSRDTETDAFIQMSVASGLGDYNLSQGGAGHDRSDSNVITSEIMFTAQTVTGETEVIHEHTEHFLTSGGQGETDEEDNETEKAQEETNVVEEMFVLHRYYFSVGSFSVTVSVSGGTQLSEDDIQLIIDNIRVTNGMER